MTLKKIASLTGLSVSTVSRIINIENYKCSDRKAQEKVWEIVASSGYTPNIAAKALKTGKIKTTAKEKVIYCIFARADIDEHDFFFLTIEHIVKQRALQLGYTYGASHYVNELVGERGKSLLESYKNQGIVVLGRYHDSLLQELSKYTDNIVAVGLNLGRLLCDHVVVDISKTVDIALNYITGLGHRDIFYLGETKNELRFDAFVSFMKKNNLPLEPWQICECSQNFMGGYNGAQAILKGQKIPSAVFCANDITALAAMKYLIGNGINVPGDISIISIDDIELAQFSNPALTTINIPKEELGNVAMSTLHSRIIGTHSLLQKTELDFEGLVVRESCAEYVDNKK